MIAEIGFALGRYYLSVADIVLAVEGDYCLEYEDKILQNKTWNRDMLKYVADKINKEMEQIKYGNK